jgi:hypothetical protein
MDRRCPSVMYAVVMVYHQLLLHAVPDAASVEVE